MNLSNILKPLRIDHWVKNLVIFFGYIVAILYFPSFKLDIYNLLLAFFVLCISASSNYLINEYLDKDYDKYHPIKKWRYFVKSTKSGNYIFVNYLILITLSLILSYHINFTFFYLNIFFLICGLSYNVKPLRFKDFFFR